MKIGNDWDIILKDIFESDKFRELIIKVNKEYEKKCRMITLHFLKIQSY